MPAYKLAHINHQGVDLIIIPLENSFGHATQQQQNTTINELQIKANSAGLAGTVVPVWDANNGRMGFIAPHQWKAFFESINLHFVFNNINSTFGVDLTD